MSELDRIAPEYRTVRSRSHELGNRIAELIPSDPRTDAELASLIGWQENTIAKLRRPPAERSPSKLELAAGLLSDQWEKAEAVHFRLGVEFGWTEHGTKGVLRQMEQRGLIESKGRATNYMGRPGKIRTHYRRIT